MLDRNGDAIGIVQSKLDAITVAVATGDIPQNVNFAIKGSIAGKFMTDSGVNIVIKTPSAALDVPSVAELAKSFTVRIECGGP